MKMVFGTQILMTSDGMCLLTKINQIKLILKTNHKLNTNIKSRPKILPKLKESDHFLEKVPDITAVKIAILII